MGLQASYGTMPTVNARGLLAAVLTTLMGVFWWVQVSMPPLPAEAAPPSRRSPSAGVAPPDVAMRRLAARRATPPTSAGARDPFDAADGSGLVFDPWTGVARREAVGLREQESREAAVTWPRLELIGVGHAADTGADTRVAVLAGERGVTHARVGDVVAQVYRVERVHADAVDLRLVPEDRAFTLRLR